MRAKRGWAVALAAGALWGAVLWAPAGASHGGHPACRAVASTPSAVTVSGRPYVRATHEITCNAPVDGITVMGRLKRDGQVVSAEERTCSGYRCQAVTTAPNPAGQQVWQATTSGSFVYGGIRHQVVATSSAQGTA